MSPAVENIVLFNKFSPYRLPGLAAAFDASDLSSITADASNRVSQWNDKSGNIRHLLQGTGAAQPLLLPWTGANYAYLPGVNGNYGSTPSAAANQITGDIDIVAYVAPRVWISASGAQYICGKWTNAGQRSYRFDITNATTLNFINSTDGTANSTNATSDATVPFSNAQGGWVRVTWTSATGAVRFYTSTQALGVGASNVTWSQLGSTISGTIGTTKAGTDPLEIGAIVGGTNSPFKGNVYYVELRNSIGGSAAVKFDASQATHNATSWVSSTGETWTVNQSGSIPAQIVGKSSVLFDGAAYYMKTSGFTLNQPESVYVVGKQNVWVLNCTLVDGVSGVEVMELFQSGSTPNVALYAGSSTVDNTGWALGANAVISALWNGASSGVRVNQGVAASGNTGAGNGGGLTLGARSNGAAFSAWQAQKIFVFAAAHDTATQNRMIRWLSQQEGITV